MAAESAAPSEGDEVAEAALLASEPVLDSRAERAELALEAASLEMLLRAELAAASAVETAELTSDPTRLVMEAPLELTAEPIEEMAEAALDGAPPTAEVIWERTESTWALATPAAKTAVAMVEKRILMFGGVVCVGRQVVCLSLMWRGRVRE